MIYRDQFVDIIERFAVDTYYDADLDTFWYLDLTGRAFAAVVRLVGVSDSIYLIEDELVQSGCAKRGD